MSEKWAFFVGFTVGIAVCLIPLSYFVLTVIDFCQNNGC